MELTKEQLLQLHNYIYVSGIKFYDVRTELVDHFANLLEQRLEENPDLNFKREIEKIHKNFSDNGFSKLLKQKTKSVTYKFFKHSLQHLLSFFKIPKIIITGFIFVVLLKAQFFFSNIENFFLSLFIFSVLLMFISAYNAMKRNKQEPFLSLSLTLGFMQVYHILVMLLQFSYSRSSESLANTTHNTIFIACFTLLFLFFWSGEYVYQQNKKLVKEQYPNILV
jgi:hypothetical protein